MYVFVAAKRDKTCACIVSHTYKQIRKLWDNADKVNTNQRTLRMIGKFDADIDRSTSSDTGVLSFIDNDDVSVVELSS